MPKGPAARVGDQVAHAAPPVLSGSGSPNVFIGKRPAWRGVGAASVAPLQSAKQAADATIDAAVAATIAAAGTPGLPAVKAAEETIKAVTAAAMGATVLAAAAAGGDIHSCATPLPPVPHGPGVVINGSTSVRVNGLPACRQGDQLIEAVGPPSKVVGGEPSVRIGG